MSNVLPDILTAPIVQKALAEDLGRSGDITSAATIPANKTAKAVIRARAPGHIAGLDVARMAFILCDPALTVTLEKKDGDAIKAGDTLLSVSGNARAILAAERTALNFLCHLSGIATETAKLVALTEGTKAQICDTRKTTPGLRTLEKYAVRCGGGTNHRFGLDDAILIKDNHIAVAGGIRQAVTNALDHKGHMVKIEVEVDTLDQLEQILDLPIDAVLLDNMDPDTLKKAVQTANGRFLTEASGGVNAETVKAITQSGVGLISVGRLTHSAPILDLGLDIEL